MLVRFKRPNGENCSDSGEALIKYKDVTSEPCCSDSRVLMVKTAQIPVKL